MKTYCEYLKQEMADNVYHDKTPKTVDEQNKKITEQQIDADASSLAEQKIHKIIAVLQHFIIYLAHVSKGAPKKMVQLFEAFIEICDENKLQNDDYKCLTVQYYNNSKFFLTFDFYQQYAMGLLAYLITPIFYRLVESNISVHNDKQLVSSLRFVDFIFKFHKDSFMWKHLDISPEMLEVNRAPELRPITVDIFNYMVQKHMAKSSFSLFDYKFDSLIASEIFAVTKTTEVLSALFSFSLDETLPLKKHYQDLLAKTQKEYQSDKSFYSTDFIDAISSLQIVLGDLHYFDDELEKAGIYYRGAIEALRKLGSKNDDDRWSTGGYHKGTANITANGSNSGREHNEDNETMNPEQLYLFVRNMLKVGMIYETRKQYEQAYLIYGEVCRRVIRERDIAVKELGAGIVVRRDIFGKLVFVKTSVIGTKNIKEEKYYDNIEYPKTVIMGNVNHKIAQPQPLYFHRISPNTNDMLFRKMTYEGLKLMYLPFLVKLQILEKSHMGGIARTHLEQLDKEFEHLTFIIDHDEANILEADFYLRVADILYYKNSDLKEKNGKNRLTDNDEDKYVEHKTNKNVPAIKNVSCTACYYYHKALSKLLCKNELNKDKNGKSETTVIKLLRDCIGKLSDEYRNMKFCTVLARILSDWGNVFLSCDDKDDKTCYICDGKNANTMYYLNQNENKHICRQPMDCARNETQCKAYYLKKYFNYMDSKLTQKNCEDLSKSIGFDNVFIKLEIAFAMYTISFQAFNKANNPNRAAYQIYKMLRLFKHYKIYNETYINKLSKKAIQLLWHVADGSNALERKKRMLDFDEKNVPLQYLLVDNEIAILAVSVNELYLAKALELNPDERNKKLNELYKMHIASPHGIIYSISAHIFQLRLKADINYEAYQILISTKKNADMDKEKMLDEEIDFVLGEKVTDDNVYKIFGKHNIKDNIFEMLITESIYCLKEIVRLSKTLGETYLFNHSFMGKTHERLCFWVYRYEKYNKRYNEKYKENADDTLALNDLLKYYLDNGWENQLSVSYECQQALLYYQKSLEIHTEGKAYHTLIDNLCYVKDDFNDRSDHFSIALERHRIVNGEIDDRIKELKEFYKDSDLHDPNNYFGTDRRSGAK